MNGIKRLAIIGDGKIAGDCIAAVASTANLNLRTYVYHGTNAWSQRNLPSDSSARKVECTNANEPEVVETLRAERLDLIINVNSFDILRAPLLGAALDGAINFHNGPLPQYRGANIPTWAIYNGEKEHGVTWHRVASGIDAGDIVAEERFPIAADETAVSLIFKCLGTGLRLFERLIGEYAERGALGSKPQTGTGHYYRAKDLPNGGYVDFEWPRDQLSRFARALTFRPFPEHALQPRLRIGAEMIYAGVLEVMNPEPGSVPGTVLELANDHLLVAAKDSTIKLDELTNAEGEWIELAALPIGRGTVLTTGGS